MPRLELCAALLLANLYKTVKNSMRLQINKTRFWSDSTITLKRIKSSPHEFKTFVANRISEIQELTQQADWKHVPTKENPADLVSRGQLPQEFLGSTLWKNGPGLLTKAETAWPRDILEDTIDREDEKKGITVLTSVSGKMRFDLWTRFSSLTKLLRITAYCLRFIKMSRRQMYSSGSLSPGELQGGLYQIISAIQRQEFHEEIHSLLGKGDLPKNSRLLRLNPFIKEDLLRVGGRIQNAEIDYQQKHPVLLPKNHPITDLIIRDNHERQLHSGANGTLYGVRLRFWPIDGRLAVRRVLHSCLKCFRAKPTEPAYIMGNLPKERVTEARPFENTGVDYCGPFFVKEKRLRNRGRVKVYAAIFVCFSTKAVHVELVGDLTTELFIASLRRFIARRGKPGAIYSDNGTNFVGAKNELSDLYGYLASRNHNEKIKRYLHEQSIEWHFSPPRTPHFGGIWEAAVKSLKHHLLRTLGETYKELSTYMCEIEAVLNSSPLTPMSSDLSDLCAFHFHFISFPGHFLVGKPLISIPALDFSQTRINRLSSWQHMQKLKQDLWKRWSQEYLNEMNVRSKWHTGSADLIKLGTLVVLRDENQPPLRWKLGRIVEVHPGRDGIIRVVHVKTESGIFERGVKKISPLPIET